MDRIREKIAQQKLNMSASSNEPGSANVSALSATAADERHVAFLSRDVHRESDAVTLTPHDLYGPDNPPVITMRKVAVGPKAPTYKGQCDIGNAQYR